MSRKDMKNYSRKVIEIKGELWYEGATKAARQRLESYALKNTSRMFVGGQYIPKSHPLHKPGRYTSFEEAWSHAEIDKVENGDVYIISNPAWPGWYKVGKAVSAYDRLNGYQTSSPFRDYKVEYYQHFNNHHDAETSVHNMLAAKGIEFRKEWFKTDLETIKNVISEVDDEKISPRHRDEHNPQYDLGLCNP